MGTNFNTMISNKFNQIMGKKPVAKKLADATVNAKQTAKQNAAKNLDVSEIKASKLAGETKAAAPQQLLLTEKTDAYHKAYAKANAKLNVTLPSSGKVYLPGAPTFGERVKASLLGALVATKNAMLTVLGALLGPALFVYDKFIQNKMEKNTSKAVAKQQKLAEEALAKAEALDSAANKKALKAMPSDENVSTKTKKSEALKSVIKNNAMSSKATQYAEQKANVAAFAELPSNAALKAMQKAKPLDTGVESTSQAEFPGAWIK